jgi:hypothetical protein
MMHEIRLIWLEDVSAVCWVREMYVEGRLISYATGVLCSRGVPIDPPWRGRYVGAVTRAPATVTRLFWIKAGDECKERPPLEAVYPDSITLNKASEGHTYENTLLGRPRRDGYISLSDVRALAK